MLNNIYPLDSKSIHKLSSKGLSLKTLKDQINDELDFTLELWRSQGLNIVKHQGNFYFATKFISIQEAEFCIVDIETNGSKIDKHQIIEIAAVKIKNNKILGTYESLVHCKNINKHISDITGITTKDTKNAPSLKQVMYEFKHFIGDTIFVAHDVKFDYNFISQSLQKVSLEPLLNRSLCSLFLAERTIESYRYALSYLNKLLNLYPNAIHHRAMSDVMTTYELFKLSLNNLDDSYHFVEDIIKFSKEAKRLKRPKFDPFLKNQDEEKVLL
ncbi:MAG: 3'-5' exonuclease [Sulfurimonas sp.]|nr:3'-5' exonuclease [Sulfurimonas sp.]